MDLFDVFVGFNADFNLSVKHEGNEVMIYFTIIKPDNKPVSPVLVKVTKDATYSVEDIQRQIVASINSIATALAPLEEQIKEMVAKPEPKKETAKPAKAAKAEKPAKPEPPSTKDDIPTLGIIADIDKALSTSTSSEDIQNLWSRVNDWNKRELECRPITLTRFQEAYKKLTEKKDSFQEDLF